MDKENVINEGVLDKIFNLIKRGKTSKLYKAFGKDKNLQKLVKDYETAQKKVDDMIKKKEKSGEFKFKGWSGTEWE